MIIHCVILATSWYRQYSRLCVFTARYADCPRYQFFAAQVIDEDGDTLVISHCESLRLRFPNIKVTPTGEQANRGFSRVFLVFSNITFVLEIFRGVSFHVLQIPEIEEENAHGFYHVPTISSNPQVVYLHVVPVQV